KSAVEIVDYVDCTIKDELLCDEDDENQSTSINDTTNNSSNLTLNSTNNQTIDDEQDDEMCQVFGGAEAEDLVDNKN
ncbi:unnamed protein product, partial [Rotaria sp. Silwood2]